MAGTKGRSGGSRANTGGARLGAGRPKKAAVKSSVVVAPVDDGTTAQKAAELFLLAIMRCTAADEKLRVDAAKTLFKGGKAPEVGKKEQRAGAAKEASTGRFAASAAPKLVHSR